MHRQFTPDVYAVGHQNIVQKQRRCQSEQIIRNRAKLPSPSSYSLNTSIAYESATLTRTNYAPKNLFSLASPASDTNRRSIIYCTPSQNTISSSFDQCSSIADYSSLYVRSTPTQLGTSSFDKYMSPYDNTPRRNSHSASNSNFSLDAGGNPWSLLSQNSNTPTRARAISIDSPQSLSQLLSMHYSPCSCKNNPKRKSFTSPVASQRFTCPSGASTPTLNSCAEIPPQGIQSQEAGMEGWEQADRDGPSSYHTRKRPARGHCHGYTWIFDVSRSKLFQMFIELSCSPGWYRKRMHSFSI